MTMWTESLCSLSEPWFPDLKRGPSASDFRWSVLPLIQKARVAHSGGLVASRGGWYLTHDSDGCSMSGEHSTLQEN